MKNYLRKHDSASCFNRCVFACVLFLGLVRGLGNDLLLLDREVLRAAPVITNIDRLTEIFVETDGTNFLVVGPDMNEFTRSVNSVARLVTADGELVHPFGLWTGSSNALSKENLGVSNGRFAFIHNLQKPSVVIFDPGEEPFLRTETQLPGFSFTQSGPLNQHFTSGNDHGFMGWAAISSQVPSKYVMISRNGISTGPFVLPTINASEFRLAAGPRNFLAMWKTLDWNAVVIAPDGRLVSSQPIQLGPRVRVQMDVAANEHAYLVIWPETQNVMGQRVSFTGELLDPVPLPLFQSGELEYRLFGSGNKWTAISRNLRVVDIIATEGRVETVQVRPAVFNARANSAAVNRFGQGLTVWADGRGMFYQHWEGTNKLSPAVPLLQKQRQTSPIISGGTEGYMAFWLTRGGMALEAAFLNNEGEVQSYTTRTNRRETFTIMGAGNSGNKHLVLFTTNTFSPLSGLIFDAGKAAEGGDPKLMAIPGIHHHSFKVLPQTNGFLVANTNAGFAHVSFTGKVSVVPGPRVQVASSGETIWAATHSNNQVGFGEWKPGSALSLSITFPGKNQRVAAAGKFALLTWRSTSLLSRDTLQAMLFNDGERTLLQPLSLIKFFPGTNDAPYEVAASNNGFLVYGMDPENEEANFPMRRQFMFHIHTETGLIRSNITLLDGQLLEMPSVAGGENDFLMVSTRGDDGVYVAKQWILPTSTDFLLNVTRDGEFHKLMFEGESGREYLLERTIDFLYWDPTAYVIPGDLLYLLPRAIDTFEFFRMRAVPY